MKLEKQRQVTPKLRFPEFRDAGDWEERQLRDTCERIAEKVGKAKLTPVSITAGYGFVSQVDKFGRDISGAQYENYTFLRRGDFAYNRGYSKKFPQGYICQLKEFDQAAASTAFICFRLRQEYEEGFLQGLFDCNFHGRQLAKYITSSARGDGLLNINPGHFFDMKLPFPQQLGEQQKIADCLSSLDDLIAAQNRKLDALKAHKQGLLQQLFPAEGETLPRLRFAEFRDAPEWEEKPLGSKTTKVGSGITPKGGEINYQDKGRPFVRSQNVGWGELILEDVAHIDDKTHATFLATEIMERDVLLNISGASIGRSAIANSKISGGNVNQHVCIIRPKPYELNPDFLNQYLLSPYGQNQIDSFQAGGNRQGLNFAQIRSFSIPLPQAIDEQEKIADCLSSLDDLIAVQAQKIDALKTHKKGVMQQLFPSPEEVLK